MRTFTAMLMIAIAAACQSGSEGGADAGAEGRPPAPDVTPEPPASDVVLRVEPDRTAPGETVELVLHNGSQGGIGYNLCTSALERRVGEGWEPVPSDRVCTMELRMLEPGQDARYPLELPQDLAAGTYRASTNVERMETGAREGVTSNTFEVG